MTNIYTGRSEMEIFEACVGEYLFFKNSLLNFHPGAANLPNLGSGPNNEIFQSVNPLYQGKVCGIPCVTVEYPLSYFEFPVGLDNYLGEDTAFTVEYLGWPQDRGYPTYMALFGQTGAASPYLGLSVDNRVRMNFGAGAQTSDTQEGWRKDAPLHFVVTRAAGDNPNFQAFLNGTVALWAGAETVAAGNQGFTDAGGLIFNHAAPLDAIYPFFGHHLMLRFYSQVMTEPEVRWLFQRAQKIVPHDLFHIPIWLER